MSRNNELPGVEKLRQLAVLTVDQLLRSNQTKEQRNLGLSSNSNDEVSSFFLDTVTVAPLPAWRDDVKHAVTNYHRVFVTRNNPSLYYEEVGWVINADITRCMICQVLFNQNLLGTDGKHHCRACGNIICSQCSPDTAIVAGLSEDIEVRVCRVCCWGQQPVQRMNSRKLGKSLLSKEEAIVIHELPAPGEEKKEINLEKIPLEYDLKIIKNVKRSIKELHSLLPNIRIKKYGQTELLPVTRVFTLKLFYFFCKNEEMFSSSFSSSSKRKRVSIASPSNAPDVLHSVNPDEVFSSYLKVNVCITDRVSKPLKVSPNKVKFENESSLIPIVFNQLAQREKSAEVLDIALNDKVYEQFERDETLPKQLLEEIFIGASILYPDFIFTHSERDSSDSPTSSETPRTVITMSLPPLEASQKLTFVFTSVTEIILQARSFSSEDILTNAASVEDRFFRFLTEISAGYTTSPRVRRASSTTLEETFSLKAEKMKIQTHHRSMRGVYDPSSEENEEERIRRNHMMTTITAEEEGGEEKANKENILPDNEEEEDASTIITQSECSGLGQKYTKLPSLRINTTLSRTSSFSSTLSILRSEDGFTTASHSHSTRSIKSPSSSSSLPPTPEYNATHAGKTPMKRQKSMQSSAWTFMTHSLGVSHSGVVLPKQKNYKKNEKNQSFIPPILFNNNNDGQKYLTKHCLDVIKEVSIDIITNDHLKGIAKQNPTILLGWQIIVMNHYNDNNDSNSSSIKGLYVITGVKQSLLYGKMFRISCFDENDQWIKLKLLDYSKGYTFQLFRKVIDIKKTS